MAKANVLNWNKEEVSQLELNEKVFLLEVNTYLLQSVVKWQLARKRKGTHKTQTRTEVRGGGKKPFRQKGTGNARQGSIRSPLLKGGAVVHGPQPRSYDWAMPKKIRQKALATALSYVHSKQKFFIVKDMSSFNGKTKELIQKLQKMGWDRALLVDEKKDEKFKRACQNLPGVKFITAEGLNVYDVLKFNTVVVTPETFNTVYRKCGHVSSH